MIKMFLVAVNSELPVSGDFIEDILSQPLDDGEEQTHLISSAEVTDEDEINLYSIYEELMEEAIA